MNRIILLDASPLGILANPGQSTRALQCRQWAISLVSQGDRPVISEVDDGDEVIVAPSNVAHLSLFVPAAEWQSIQ